MTIQDVAGNVESHRQVPKCQAHGKKAQKIDLIYILRIQKEKMYAINPANTSIDRGNQQDPNKKKGYILFDMMKYQLNRQGI